jgi:hypothetical protein
MNLDVKSSKLYKRVYQKLKSPSESAFDKRLQRKSNQLGLASSSAALVVLAAEKKMGYQKEFQSLTETQQNRVASIIQTLGNKAQTEDETNLKSFGKRRINFSNDLSTEFMDPYLKDGDYQQIPSGAYSLMYILENSIRAFIIRVLEEAHGQKWWKRVKEKKSLTKIVESVESRKTTEFENWYHSKRGAHEIFYTDYDNLLKIIKVFDKEFSKFFKKGVEKNLIGKLEELTPSRNVIAHNNPITKKDLERLKVNARDWFGYMQHLYKEDEK